MQKITTWNKYPDEKIVLKPGENKKLVVLAAEFGQPLTPILVMAFQSTLPDQLVQFMMHGLYVTDGNNHPIYLADQVRFYIELPEFPKG